MGWYNGAYFVETDVMNIAAPQTAAALRPAKVKNYSLSLMRFLAMLSLTTCHMFQQAGHEITANLLSTAVQVFLLLSGYLYAHKEFTDPAARVSFVLKNVVKILLDFYLCLFLLILPVYYFKAPEYLTGSNIYRLLLGHSGWYGVHHLWYISSCLLCYMATPALYDLKRYFRAKNCTLAGVIVLVAVMEVLLKSFESYFQAYWLSCYVLGYFVADIKDDMPKLRRVWFAALVLGIGLTALTYWYRFYYYDSVMGQVSALMYYAFVFLFQYGVVLFGLGVFLTLLITTRGIRWPGWARRIFDTTDTLSYDVYLVHMIFVEGCLTVIGRLGNVWLEAVITLTEVFVAAWVLHWISGRLKPLVNRLTAKL